MTDFEFMTEVQNEVDFEVEFFKPNGTNLFETCRSKILTLLGYQTCSDLFSKDCFDFGPTQNVPKNSEFFAMSSFYWDFGAFLNATEAANLDLIEAEEKVKAICENVADDISQRYGATVCFKTVFAINLLTEGYAIKVLKTKNIWGQNYVLENDAFRQNDVLEQNYVF
jgi:hypothetical protein